MLLVHSRAQHVGSRWVRAAVTLWSSLKPMLQVKRRHGSPGTLIHTDSHIPSPAPPVEHEEGAAAAVVQDVARQRQRPGSPHRLGLLRRAWRGLQCSA